MPFDKVDPKVDFPAMERDILSFWGETHAFDKLREINRGKPKWSFLDGPITANNPMGVHHAWGRTYKDLYQRYFAASPWTAPEGERRKDGKLASWGHELRYQNGFDCQGLWVEVEVEKEHGFASKKDIEGYGIGEFVEECKARAQKFAGIQTEQSKRLGQWMDWDNSYYTMSDENNYSIWAFLKKCHEKGLIYKGVDVMPWCPRCGTGISQMEMNEGYREVAHTSVFVLFPIPPPPLTRGDTRRSPDSPKEFLLVWTTTPWTLSSNVAAAVKPDMTYVKVKQGDRYYYLGKANFEAARSQPVQTADKSKIPGLTPIQSLFKNNGAFEVVEELPGSKLVDLRYHGPFDSLPGAAEAVPVHRVIAWDSVTESEGTGIVHIAPGCGAEDYALGKELGLPRIAPLFEDGKFRPEFGFLAGRRFDQVADDVVADLKTRGLLFAKEQYWHRYPHCWRCKDELVYRLVDEWFINMNWRDEIMDSVRQARWIPEWGLERELDWLRNMGDWMISKKRYWGLALPIWECHECGHFEIIGDREELKALAVAGWDQFDGHSPHRPWVDEVKIRCPQCGNKNVSRVKDVGNPWLDASIVSFSTMKYFTDRESWQQWFPVDFVVEAFPGQFRNWFYALLTVSTMMVGRSPFKVLKGHGLVMDDEGKPMHKSSGNAIEFNEAANKIGVDVMRWLYASTPPERNVLFGPHHTDEVRREFILPLWNVYSFFCNLARVDDFRPDVHTCTAAERSLLDQWILSDLNRLIQIAHACYSRFEIHRFCEEARAFIDVLSTWYVRRSRRRFYGEGWPADKRAAYATLYQVLTTFNRIIAPIVPFLTESIYQNLVARQCTDVPASVHHVPIPIADAGLIDEKLSSLVASSLRLMSLARSARKESNLKIRQPVAELVVVPGNDTEREAVEIFTDHFEEEINVKKVRVRADRDGLCSVKVAPNNKLLGPKFGRNLQAAKAAIAAIDGVALDQRLARGESISLAVAGADVPIELGDLVITRSYGEGWAGAADGATVVLIDTRITPELRNEGLARDIVRNVQNLRKDAGLDLADRIRLSLVTDSAILRGAIDQFLEYIAAETLASEIMDEPLHSAASKAEVKIEPNQSVDIALVRAG
ncbi:MAG: isoleucine--tRNA ligase [Planctomycetes bacterium]|nr:isoleucine--tRNA ligase [Planctomycetota bacterium]MBI3835197.1 isoleucine--tRNA ligase [Planctomycetota bacterium]